MRKRNRILVPGIAALAALLAIGLSGTAFAFHGGGVAHCDRCHSMHSAAEDGSYLLTRQDQSSTCLSCHATTGTWSAGRYYSMSGNGSVFSPGGDFFWLTKSYSWTSRSGTEVNSNPDRMGHNIIAADFGIAMDAENSTAPGGTYPSGTLGCQSCHNPHGQVGLGTADGELPISVSGSYGAEPAAGTIAGNYRLLGDAAYGRDVTVTAVISDEGTNGKYGEMDNHHVAYGKNMSEWCGSCHDDMLNSTMPKHKAGNTDTLSGGTASNYNSYVKTGDFTGTAADSYLALVPFEMQEEDRAILKAASEDDAGPVASDNVMCLTCHRAHASAFNYILRWDNAEEFLAESSPDADQLISMGAVPFASYQGRDVENEFGTYQRSLCNKCHVQD